VLVWLVTEIHCHKPSEGWVSIWVSGRPLSDDKTLDEDVAERLIGPVDPAEGERLVSVLRRQLEAAGITVVSSFAADD